MNLSLLVLSWIALLSKGQCGQIPPGRTTPYLEGTVGDLTSSESVATSLQNARNNEYANLKAEADWLFQTYGQNSSILGPQYQLSFSSPTAKDRTEDAYFTSDTIYDYTNNLQVLQDEINEIPDVSYPNCNSLCDANDEYRTMDGMCNNLQSCTWGSQFSTFRRLLPPVYDSNKGKMLNYGEGFNPIKLSRELFFDDSNDRAKSEYYLTQITAAFGQFLSHDCTATPAVTVYKNGRPMNVDCCETGETFSDCNKVEFKPPNEEKACISMVRSAPGIPDRNNKYSYGGREQMNGMTSFIDGSQIYGANEQDANKLYDQATGLMIVNSKVNSANLELLPATDPSQYCDSTNEANCFVSGDSRPNVVFSNTMMHLIFLREHNKIAKRIKELRPGWNGQKIYQETRRIIGAMLQHITYGEYLEKIIGATMMNRYNLPVTLPSTYNSQTDPSILNSFSAAAFRMGHSQISVKYPKWVNGQKNGLCTTLPNGVFNNDLFYANNGAKIGQCMLGLAKTKAQELDTGFNFDVNGFLFKSKYYSQRSSRLEFGFYLPAINILRGRDHGLPSYGEWQDFVKLHDPVGNYNYFRQESVQYLNSLYGDYKNGDLYAVGLYEEPYADSHLGHTFSSIIARQFLNLKEGDRFFFTHQGDGAKFTSVQIAELKKVKMSQIICRNGDISDNQAIPLDSFVLPGKIDGWPNSNKKCSIIKAGYPSIDVLLQGRP